MSRGVQAARALAIALMLFGGAAYSAWVLQFVLPADELSPVHAYISELSADGQPYQELFRAADIVAGVAFVVMVPLLLRLVPAQTWPRLSVAAIGVFGVNLLVGARFTLDCAPSVDQACRERLLQGDFSGDQAVHLVTSAITVLLYVVSATCAARWWPPGMWRNSARVALGIVLVSTAGIAFLHLFADSRFVGLLVRLRLLTMVVLLVIGALYLLSAARDRAR